MQSRDISAPGERIVAFGDFLKELRLSRYRSARELCLREGLSISYPQYSRYESGEQLPSLEMALLLGLKLGGDSREVLRVWCLDQMTGSSLPEVDQLRAAVRDALPEGHNPTSVTPLRERVSLDDVIVFNRAHLRLFESDMRYRDIFTYINAFALTEEGIAIQDIARALKVSEDDLHEFVGKLDALGVVFLLPGDRVRAAKKNFYFPDDAEFFNLRNKNIEHNLNQILSNVKPEDFSERRAYRALVTRELTSDQFALLLDSLESLMSRMVGLEENEQANAVYSLCIGFGKRFERAEVALSESSGLVTEDPFVRNLENPENRPNLVV